MAGLPTTAACPAFAYVPAAERAGGRSPAGRGRAAGGQDQPGSVRHRPGRACARPTACPATRSTSATSSAAPARVRPRRWRAGWCASRWAPTPRVRAGCRRRSPTSSAGSPARACCPPAGWCPPAARSTACRCSRSPSTTPAGWPAWPPGTIPKIPYSRPDADGLAFQAAAPGPVPGAASRARTTASSSAIAGRRRPSTGRLERLRALGAELVEVDLAPFLRDRGPAVRRALDRRAAGRAAGVRRAPARGAAAGDPGDPARGRRLPRADRCSPGCTGWRRCGRRCGRCGAGSTRWWCRPPRPSIASTRSRPSRAR